MQYPLNDIRAHMVTHEKKKLLEINFIYLGKTENLLHF